MPKTAKKTMNTPTKKSSPPKTSTKNKYDDEDEDMDEEMDDDIWDEDED